MKMKSIYLFAAILLCTGARAQSVFMDDTHTFYGALTGGVSFTQVDGDNYYGYNKIGFSAGGGMYMRVADYVAMSMEILYSQKGSRSTKSLVSSDNSFLINKYDINLNYAEVPLQIWYFDKHNHHFGGGFSYSQLINSTEKAQTDPEQKVIAEMADGKKYSFNKSDINIVLSGNFRLWKGLYAGVRFNYSMAPIRKDLKVPPGFGRAEQYNNIVILKFTYLFMQNSSYYGEQQ